MIGYFDLFPEKCQTELRNIYVLDDFQQKFPAGNYLFTEYFCCDLSCDCQRVLIKVLRCDDADSDGPDSDGSDNFYSDSYAAESHQSDSYDEDGDDDDDATEEVATISFTWNDDHDDSWQPILHDQENPFLDPFHYQASFATEIMKFWHQMYLTDVDYASRLIRHYHELRKKFPTKSPLENGYSDFPRQTPRPSWQLELEQESPEDRKKRHRSLRLRNAKTKADKRKLR